MSESTLKAIERVLLTLIVATVFVLIAQTIERYHAVSKLPLEVNLNIRLSPSIKDVTK